MSYIWDDMDFLNYILNIVKDNIYLVSFDVISLYINIFYNLGVEVIDYWINKNESIL